MAREVKATTAAASNATDVGEASHGTTDPSEGWECTRQLHTTSVSRATVRLHLRCAYRNSLVTQHSSRFMGETW